MNVFEEDDNGRTVLFHYAAIGDRQEVENILFKLSGTGIAPQRLRLIEHKDKYGLTAAEVAQKEGQQAIADLLKREAGRMEYFE